MRPTRLVLGCLLVFLCGPVVAQEASIRETRCWVGDVTFSAGMGIGAGDSTAVCEAGTGWKAASADTPVAGCLLEGELSSVGAVVGIRNNDTLLLQCGANGAWTTMPANAGL